MLKNAITSLDEIQGRFFFGLDQIEGALSSVYVIPIWKIKGKVMSHEYIRFPEVKIPKALQDLVGYTLPPEMFVAPYKMPIFHPNNPPELRPYILDTEIGKKIELIPTNWSIIENLLLKQRKNADEILSIKFMCFHPEIVLQDVPNWQRIIVFGITQAFSQLQDFNQHLYKLLRMEKIKDQRILKAPLNIFRRKEINIDISRFAEWDTLRLFLEIRNVIIHRDGIIDKVFCSKLHYDESAYVGSRIHPGVYEWRFFKILLTSLKSYGNQIISTLKTRIQGGTIIIS